MFETRLLCAENLIRVRVDRQCHNVAHDRQIMVVLLRNCEPIDEHRKSLSTQYITQVKLRYVLAF
ncbi:hypothetical protein D9M71_243060 [compost metagenome]